MFRATTPQWIAPFDAERDDDRTLLDGVGTSGGAPRRCGDGTMAYLPAGDYEAVRRVTWIVANRQRSDSGQAVCRCGVIPGGSDCVAIREQGDTDIWIATPSRQTMTQLTAEPANETRPVWSPDGESIVFQSDRAGNDIYRRDAQGAGQAERLTEQKSVSLEGPHSMTPDGRAILFGLQSSIASVTPPSTDVHTLVSGTATMRDPRVSPDGRYLAYLSSESGRFEVWVTEYPPKPARRWRVSTAGSVAALGTRQP